MKGKKLTILPALKGFKGESQSKKHIFLSSQTANKHSAFSLTEGSAA